MPTYLDGWNPKSFKWDNNAAQSCQTRTGIPVRDTWSAGGTKRIHPGDRIFVGRQGSEDSTSVRGLIASGVAVSPYFEDLRWDGSGKITTYNVIDFDTILTPDLVLPRKKLKDGVLSSIRWGTQRGGIQINDHAAVELEKRWAEHLKRIEFHSAQKRLARNPYQPDPRKRKLIEEAAIQETIRYFRAQGFDIRDRQNENVGWDLEAVKGEELIYLEVKGLSGTTIAVELTPNEYANMQSHRANYAVCVVVDAVGPGRSLTLFRFDSVSGGWRDGAGRMLTTTELVGARLTL